MRFIVIDWIDWSGKETQVSLLYDYLLSRGKKVLRLDYPRYGYDSAKGLEGYLQGDYEADPKQASILFAYDRLVDQLKRGYNNYDYVISDRYTSANIIHQGARIQENIERYEFQEWLENFEYNELKLLRPDLVLFLDVDPETSMKNIDERGLDKDTHENKEHLEKAYFSWKNYALNTSSNWKIIECGKKGIMRTREEIEKEIRTYL